MKKFWIAIEKINDRIYDTRVQAKAIIYVFGLLGLVALVGAFWNPGQLILFVLCAIMVICGLSELKK